MSTVLGWPRSGTHWLKSMLESVTGHGWTHSHACPEETDEEHVLIVRDPRDAFASHWRLYQHDHPGTKRTELEHLSYFMEGHDTAPHLRGGWVLHAQRLLELEDAYPLVTYECLYDDPYMVMIGVLVQIDRGDILARRIDKAIQDTRGRRCDPSSLPVSEEMGRPGKWNTWLLKSTIRALQAYCGSLMVELGYEIGKET